MHTHARRIVQGFIQKQLGMIHKARRELLCAGVCAVMSGHSLSLSRLARALIGQGNQKAALKRVDRFMGNQRIAQEAQVVGAALVRTLCRGRQPLVVAVDWSAVAPAGVFVELRALLDSLHAWIPEGVKVIIVTDAGFRRPWFTQVERLGWSWIGRIRGSVCVSREGSRWQQASTWFAKATGKACRWHDCWFTQKFRFACDMVLYRHHALGRKHYGRAGHGSTPRAREAARTSAREPWLLEIGRAHV